MTFRTVDLQMSVPRTQELGSTHGQAIQRPVSEQELLAKESVKHTEELRSKNTAVEHPSSLSIKNEQERKQGSNKKKKKRNGNDDEALQGEEKEAPFHPYKGHHFDIKL